MSVGQFKISKDVYATAFIGPLIGHATSVLIDFDTSTNDDLDMIFKSATSYTKNTGILNTGLFTYNPSLKI